MNRDKLKERVNAQPIYWGWALVVFICALYLIKYIRAEDTSKIIDFYKQVLIVKDREGQEITRYPLKKLQVIEVLKFKDGDYTHYELNFRFEDKRINLYASKDDLLPCIYAQDLSNRLHKPVVKIETEE